MLGRQRHDGHAGDRVHLDTADAIFDRMSMVAHVHVGHSQTVVEEAHIELALFEDSADMLIIFRGIAVGPTIWVTPSGGDGGAVLGL